jgi:hypothetical protein
MRIDALIVLVCALALTACGSSSSSSSTAGGTASQIATAASTPTSTAAGTPAATTTTTAVASGGGICRAADLSLSFLGQQGATGHGELGFKLHNTSARRCTTFGYPGILFLGKAGQSLPTVPMHTTHDFFGMAPLADVAVAPGASVSFRLGVTHGASSTVGCTTAYGLQVIPPNDTATLRVNIPDGAYECRTATVSPVRPGVSAYP